jgi:hypothetical protein
MRNTFAFGLALGLAGALVAGPAGAQVKGAGKLSISIIATPGGGPANPAAKAAGTFSAKPSASVAGKAPTGGALTSFKLAKDVGDPLKPGFAAGRYVIEFETTQTSTGDIAGGSGVTTFATLTVDALGKCTIDAHETVDGDATGDLCGTPDALCAPSAAGKCSVTTYQIAGIPNFTLAPGDGQPTAQRVRIRTLPNEADCETGDVMLGGAPLIGATTCHAGPVVGVVGVANGKVSLP